MQDYHQKMEEATKDPILRNKWEIDHKFTKDTLEQLQIGGMEFLNEAKKKIRRARAKKIAINTKKSIWKALDNAFRTDFLDGDIFNSLFSLIRLNSQQAPKLKRKFVLSGIGERFNSYSILIRSFYIKRGLYLPC